MKHTSSYMTAAVKGNKVTAAVKVKRLEIKQIL